MSDTAEHVIEVAGLVKRYADRAVVDGLDLTLSRGEVLALLGPNGAGKTTTVETIEGYRRADAGSVRVFGLDPRRDAERIRARSGLMLQRADLWNQVRVAEAIRLFAAFYPNPLDPSELLERVGLAALSGARYRTLSGGERQRLALALALVGRPELAILDEPTAAMDVSARRATWTLLHELRASGTAVLLTTHLLDEAEAVADRLAIMDRGRLVASGTPAELRAGTSGAAGAGLQRLHLSLARALSPDEIASLAALQAVEELTSPRPGGYALSVRDANAALLAVATWLSEQRVAPLELRFGEESLEEVFLRLTSEPLDLPRAPVDRRDRR
ncbi:MAG: ABC transporter ATP-binding protein [Candidatus Limnocylindrales bacterium]